MKKPAVIKIESDSWDRLMGEERVWVTVLPNGPGHERYQFRLHIFNPASGEERYVGEPFVRRRREEEE